MWLDTFNEMRKESEMSLDEISAKSGIPKGTLAKITSGITKAPPLETMRKLVYSMGYTLDDLDRGLERSDHFSKEEKAHIKKYRALDPYGKDTVDAVLENELKRCQEQARPQKPKMHLMRMVASDGTYKERWMTDEEVQALKEQINTLEEPTGI